MKSRISKESKCTYILEILLTLENSGNYGIFGLFFIGQEMICNGIHFTPSQTKKIKKITLLWFKKCIFLRFFLHLEYFSYWRILERSFQTFRIISHMYLDHSGMNWRCLKLKFFSKLLRISSVLGIQV